MIFGRKNKLVEILTVFVTIICSNFKSVDSSFEKKLPYSIVTFLLLIYFFLEISLMK